jgi:uncharacterized protein YdhG (YjbR/CyaY superfamily)
MVDVHRYLRLLRKKTTARLIIDVYSVKLHRFYFLSGTLGQVYFCYHMVMKPKTVDEYINSYTSEQKSQLIKLRQIIRDTLPDTIEALKWGAPATLDKDGMILIVFSGHKQHMNLVGTPSTKEAFVKDLSDYETGKGSIKLAYDKPLPESLIKKMVKYRADEYRNHGVKWI